MIHYSGVEPTKGADKVDKDENDDPSQSLLTPPWRLELQKSLKKNRQELLLLFALSNITIFLSRSKQLRCDIQVRSTGDT
jgi:hypothetical protein